MQALTITFGILFAGAFFLLGRVCVINNRLRRIITRRDKKVSMLNDLVSSKDVKIAALSELIDEIKHSFTPTLKNFAVKEISTGVFCVCMSQTTNGGGIDIPVKIFYDPDDYDFARREAEELTEKLNEQ